MCGLFSLGAWFNYSLSSDLGFPVSEVMAAEIPTSLSELESVRMTESVLLEAFRTWLFRVPSLVWVLSTLGPEISKR